MTLLEELDDLLVKVKTELGRTDMIVAYEAIKDARLIVRQMKIEEYIEKNGHHPDICQVCSAQHGVPTLHYPKCEGGD